MPRDRLMLEWKKVDGKPTNYRARFGTPLIILNRLS
jgi:hypothetical protein